MGKFNKKDEGVRPTIVNHMGEKAYKPNAEEELVSTVRNGLQGSITRSLCVLMI